MFCFLEVHATQCQHPALTALISTKILNLRSLKFLKRTLLSLSQKYAICYRKLLTRLHSHTEMWPANCHMTWHRVGLFSIHPGEDLHLISNRIYMGNSMQRRKIRKLSHFSLTYFVSWRPKSSFKIKSSSSNWKMKISKLKNCRNQEIRAQIGLKSISDGYKASAELKCSKWRPLKIERNKYFLHF